jgi:cytochrome c-type biogenesis protein CcmF
VTKLRIPAGLALVGGFAGPLIVFGEFSVLTSLGVTIGLWTMLSALVDPVKKLAGTGPRFTRGMIGMQLAHFGIAMTVLGITVTSSFSVVTDEGMQPGEELDISGYTFRFDGLRDVQGPNYDAVQGVFTVFRNGEEYTELRPEKRIYRVQTNPMSEAGIDAGWGGDLFIALGERLGDGSWSVRIQYKPLIRFIWFGCLIMALGGIVAVSDPRYRRGEASA